jgi:hypothetical protein
MSPTITVASHPWGHVFEDFAMLSTASLVYFDGTSARTVASGLRYANGVQLSAESQARYSSQKPLDIESRPFAKRGSGAT